MLAEAEPVVAYFDACPREPFALAKVAGLRWEADRHTLAPAPWHRLLCAAAPMAVLVAASADAVIVSRQLPL